MMKRPFITCSNLSLALISVLLLSQAAPLLAQCRTVTSWSALKSTIEGAAAGSTLTFCPFTITKPTSSTLSIRNNLLSIGCSTRRACILQGAGTHVTLFAFETVVSGFTFQNATTSSVFISPRSRITANRRKIAFDDCLFQYNTALSSSSRGGAISSPSTDGNVVSVLLSNNEFIENRAQYGGAILHLSQRLIIENSTFVGNQATQHGGAIYAEQLSTNGNNELNIVDSNFTNNQAVRRGGGICCQGRLLQSTMSNLTFGSNYAGTFGAAVEISAFKSLQLVDTAFTSNNVKYPDTTGIVQIDSMNGVYVAPTVTAIDNAGCNGLVLHGKCLPLNYFPYRPGALVSEYEGVKFAQGLKARVIARTGNFVTFDSPNAITAVSSIRFHDEPDGAAIYPLPNGEYVYVSNSELTSKRGGVFGLYFDAKGGIKDYKQLLFNTSQNCNGGMTPWGSWVSCEEIPGGQCWQVDPTGVRAPQQTKMGGLAGGQFEAFVVDNRDPLAPVFYVTEDKSDGALRRFRPSTQTAGWDMLHGEGVLDYLNLFPNGTFEWTTNLTIARTAAYNYFRNSEGILHRNGEIWFVAKITKEIIILKVDGFTWKKSGLRTTTLANGGKINSIDQFTTMDTNLIYVTEDGGYPGLFEYDGNNSKALLENQVTDLEEVTGVDFSPDGMFLYVCMQHEGRLFEVSRLDGQPFDGRRILRREGQE